MNPASRLHSHILKIQKYPTHSEPLHVVYMKIFKVKDVFTMFEALGLLQKEVKKMERLFIRSSKIDKYEDVITLLKGLTAPLNLEITSAHILNAVNAVEPKLMVLSDAFESTELEEVDVTEDLDSIHSELDNFLEKIKTLDIDNSSKILYASVTYKLKQSIEFYSIGGKAQLEEALRVFECITKDTKESSSIIEKLHAIVEKASKVQEIVGFIVENTQKLIGN
jgi:hypothetical protein